MNASRRVVRLRARAVVAAAATGAALVLAGCTATNPQQTATPYDAGAGRSAYIGGEDANTQVQLRNFLVVSAAQGQPGRVVGALANRTADAAQVQLTVVATGADGQQQQVASATVPVGAGQFVQIGGLPAGSASPAGSIGAEPAAGSNGQFVVPSMPAPPGAVLQLFARTATGGGTSLDIPILPPTGVYAAYAPTSSPSARSTTVAPTGSPTPSANPSGAGRQPAGGGRQSGSGTSSAGDTTSSDTTSSASTSSAGDTTSSGRASGAGGGASGGSGNASPR